MNVATCRLAAVSSLLVIAASAAFADAASDKAERVRIDRERADIEQTFKARDHECRQHFVVTRCVDAAQRDRREALKPLQVQQELLNEAARRGRAAQRLESIRQKESGADAKQREAMAREQQKRLPGAASAPEAAAAASRAPSGHPRMQAPALPRTTAASAAERAVDYADRQREVAAHREDVDRRNAARLAKGKKSVPLPVPAVIPGSAPASAAPR